MRARLAPALGAGLFLLLAAAPGGTQPPGAGRIPAVHGTVLSGEQVDLPDALKGKVGVLVVGFSQASRGQVTDWGKRLATDYRGSESVVYYEMPVLAGVPRLLRGYVLKKISEDVPDRAKARFLPVYGQEAEWKAAAEFGKADVAYVLVVDGAGAVRWHGSGGADDALYAEVKRQVERAAGR
jgi:hypothetical protein